MQANEELLSQAQDFVYQAWEESSASRRKTLALQALQISPLCSDAFNILAELETNSKAAYSLYKKALDAAEMALGPEVFEEDKGHFWGLLETRPYMRARAGMARKLWHLGDLKQAVQHYEAMLLLNPNDNQGMRYELAAVYLELDALGELANLLDRYHGEITAIWSYTVALLAFKNQGDSPQSRKTLTVAIDNNPHVPLYLLARKKVPKKMPGFMGIGDESEAQYYQLLHGKYWVKTSGAKPWLRDFLAEQAPSQSTEAEKLWSTIPKSSQSKILESIWCTNCRDCQKAVINSMSTDHGDLILKGLCAKCNGPVCRLVEIAN